MGQTPPGAVAKLRPILARMSCISYISEVLNFVHFNGRLWGKQSNRF
jgi:hypothetical protein